jgi:hypothetical protein
MPQRFSCKQPPVDTSQLTPEDLQLFGKLVHDLLKDNKWMLLEEAQTIAYQQVCIKSLEEID